MASPRRSRWTRRRRCRPGRSSRTSRRARLLAFLRLSPAGAGRERAARRHRRFPARLLAAAGDPAGRRVLCRGSGPARRADRRSAPAGAGGTPRAARRSGRARQLQGGAALSRPPARPTDPGSRVPRPRALWRPGPAALVPGSGRARDSRHRLAGCDDPIRLRAAELLFREQKVTIRDGASCWPTRRRSRCAHRQARARRAACCRERAPHKHRARRARRDNAAIYWARSDRFDTVLDLSFARPGLDALCRVLEVWVGHFTGAAVRIQPVQRIDDERWIWHVGLDAEASTFLNDLYQGVAIDEARPCSRCSGSSSAIRPPCSSGCAAGRSTLGLAMTAAQRLRLKPQNLLVNLPLARPA